MPKNKPMGYGKPTKKIKTGKQYMAGLSMLRVISNDDMVKAEQDQVRRDMEERQQSELVLGLLSYVKSCWNPARIAKKPIENIMLRALRQRNGEYEADKLGQIKSQGGSQVYMMITEVKCRGAESWLRDILLDTGTPPWDLKPTPIPDLAPDQMEEIKNLFFSLKKAVYKKLRS